MNPAPTASVGAGTAAADPPNPNHPESSLRTLPFSSIKVYKNGKLVGTVRIVRNCSFSSEYCYLCCNSSLSSSFLDFVLCLGSEAKGAADTEKPYTDLLAFLPPSSKPPNQAGAREGFDDGSLGYYPAISVFRGGAAEANFGPNFWFPPPDLAMDEDTVMADSSDTKVNPVTKKQIAGQHSSLRPMGERFNEQIAEDIVYDLVDEGKDGTLSC